MSVVSHCGNIGAILCFGLGIGLDERAGLEGNPVVAYLATVPIILIVSSLPVLPGGWGVGEAAFAYFFRTVGIWNLDLSIALSLVQRTATLLFSLLGGVFFLTHRKRVMDAVHAGERRTEASDLMSILVVGSVALDSVTTPYGSRDDVLGGAASYFSCAASLFTKVEPRGRRRRRLPGGAREDVSGREDRSLRTRAAQGRADLPVVGLVRGQDGRRHDAPHRPQRARELPSDLPADLRAHPFVFLANGDPVTQNHVLDQLTSRKFVLLDTMNLWIEHASGQLAKVLGRVDGVVLNDEEARSLAGDSNLVRAMGKLAKKGIRTLVVKKGEHGSVLLHDGSLFALPAYPLEDVRDPTGAGDTFAAGFLGHLARTGDLS